MMCNCQTMARDLSETYEGRFPPSIHAPKCEDFKQTNFARVISDGAVFIVSAPELGGVLDNITGQYQVETVALTQDQFDRLPEYDG